MKNKRGQGGFIAWFFVIVVLFAFAIFFLVLNKTWGEVQPRISDAVSDSLQGVDQSGVNVTRVLDKTGSSTRSIDSLMPFIIIGLFAFVLIAAGGIMRSPIMIIVGIIVIGVVILLGVIYSNIYNDIASSDQFADTREDSAITDLLMRYMVVIVFIAAIAVAIAVVLRGSGGQGTL